MMKEVCSHLRIFKNKDYDGVCVSTTQRRVLSLPQQNTEVPTHSSFILQHHGGWHEDCSSSNSFPALGTALDRFALLVR